jgi:hypothetical protein
VHAEEEDFRTSSGRTAGGIGMDRDEELSAGLVGDTSAILQLDKPVVIPGVDDLDAEIFFDVGS